MASEKMQNFGKSLASTILGFLAVTFAMVGVLYAVLIPYVEVSGGMTLEQGQLVFALGGLVGGVIGIILAIPSVILGIISFIPSVKNLKTTRPIAPFILSLVGLIFTVMTVVVAVIAMGIASPYIVALI